jgi:hypothetical protein
MIVVRHLGPPLGAAGEAVLASRWSTRAGARLQVRDVPLATDTATAALGRERQWLPVADTVLDWVAHADRAIACVKAPSDTARKATAAQRSALETLRTSPAASAGKVLIADSSGWSIRVAIDHCDGDSRTSVARPR